MLYYVRCSLFRCVYTNLEKNNPQRILQKFQKLIFQARIIKRILKMNPQFEKISQLFQQLSNLRIRGLLLEDKYLNQNPRCKVSYYKGHCYKRTMNSAQGLTSGGVQLKEDVPKIFILNAQPGCLTNVKEFRTKCCSLMSFCVFQNLNFDIFEIISKSSFKMQT